MERLNRILEIDEENLLAITQPHVITGDLQDAVERRGLFYPPDPASLRQSSIGGNVAECAGGPRALKYGTTKRYVLALEAVLPTGEIIRTGSKAVKNVVGYDLTQLLVGSEGTLAIITEITLRLVPKPLVQSTMQATFSDVGGAVAAVSLLLAARVLPATIELVDRESLTAVERHLGRAVAADATGAMLIIEVDGVAGRSKRRATGSWQPVSGLARSAFNVPAPTRIATRSGRRVASCRSRCGRWRRARSTTMSSSRAAACRNCSTSSIGCGAITG